MMQIRLRHQFSGQHKNRSSFHLIHHRHKSCHLCTFFHQEDPGQENISVHCRKEFSNESADKAPSETFSFLLHPKNVSTAKPSMQIKTDFFIRSSKNLFRKNCKFFLKSSVLDFFWTIAAISYLWKPTPASLHTVVILLEFTM